jgi:pyruvate,water dikinase
MTAPLLPDTFVAPAKGQWISLRDHFPRALTPEYSAILCAAMYAGEAGPFAEYGMPVKTLEVRPVHGHVYVAPAPLFGKHANSLPPAPILKLAARLAPPFRKRTKAAVRTLATRPWLADAARWYATERAEWSAASAALQGVAVDAITVDELIVHLEAVRAHARAGYERHFSLHGPDLIPTGLLLARCQDWGIRFDEVLPVLTGSSPASLGQGAELDALRAAVAASGAELEAIDQLAEVAGPELTAFLDQFGDRMVTGYDIDCLTLRELPSLVLNLARPVPDRSAPSDGEDTGLRALRRRVDPANHAELEQLVGDARATFGMRDDNGSLTGAWPMGLLRRAMLAAGRRLVASGAIERTEHALELRLSELAELLRGASDLSRVDVAERAALRAARSELDPPLTLGPEVDIPLDALPLPMRTIARAQLVLRDTFTVPLGEVRTDLRGDGIGRATFTGTDPEAGRPVGPAVPKADQGRGAHVGHRLGGRGRWDGRHGPCSRRRRPAPGPCRPRGRPPRWRRRGWPACSRRHR